MRLAICTLLFLISLVSCAAGAETEETNETNNELTGVLDRIRTRLAAKVGGGLHFEAAGKDESIEPVTPTDDTRVTASAEVSSAVAVAADGTQSELAALGEAAKQSIAGIDDHPVNDTAEARIERILAAFMELPEEERILLDLERISSLPMPEKAVELEQLWARRQVELKEIVAALPSTEKLLTGLISTISSETAAAADVIEALRDLEDHLTDIDMARDFHTLGGWPILTSLLQPQNSLEIRELSAWVIGTAVKNVPEFHGWLLESLASTEDGVSSPTVLSLLQVCLEAPGSAAGALRAKAVYALGCSLRYNPAAQQAFWSKGGLESLAVAAEGDESPPAVTTKVLLLLSDLVTEEGDSDRKDSLGSMLESAGWCERLQLALSASPPPPSRLIEKLIEARSAIAGHCPSLVSDLDIAETS